MTHHNDTQGHAGLGALALWLVPAVCIIDSAVAFASGWRPVGDIEHGLLLCFTIWLAGAGLLLSGRARRCIGGHGRELILAATLTVIGWSGLEYAAHLAEASLHPEIPFHTRGRLLHDTLHTDPTTMPGITQTAQYTTGPDGIRAAAPPEPEQSVRVLCIGGSTTECVYLDDRETWPALLERQVSDVLSAGPVWIGNVGISGFYTRDHLRFIQESSVMAQIDGIVIQPGINDLWRYLAREEDRTDGTRFRPAPAAAPVTVPPPPDPYRPVWSRSWLIQLFHTLRAEPPPEETQEGIGGREYTIRREKRATATFTDVIPDLANGLQGYRTRLEAIIDACTERGVKIVFTTQPVIWRDDLPPDVAARCWFGWLDDGRYLTLGALRVAMDQYNDVLMETCRDAGVPCVDLSPMNGIADYYYDDCHFNNRGAAEVASRVAPALAKLLAAPVSDRH